MSIIDAILTVDFNIAQALNAWASKPTTFNRLIVLFNENNFAKMAPFVCMAAWYWNKPGGRTRPIVINGLAGIFVAFFIGRILQVSLPFRARPIHTEALHLILPNGESPDILGGWSSFPSDHAAIFMALSMLAFALSRRTGVLALLYALLVVILPRVYIGVHFMTDTLAGMLVGGIAGWIALRSSLAAIVGPAVNRFALRYPSLFYALAMLFIGQLIQMFSDVRMYASVLKGILSGTF